MNYSSVDGNSLAQTPLPQRSFTNSVRIMEKLAGPKALSGCLDLSHLSEADQEVFDELLSPQEIRSNPQLLAEHHKRVANAANSNSALQDEACSRWWSSVNQIQGDFQQSFYACFVARSPDLCEKLRQTAFVASGLRSLGKSYAVNGATARWLDTGTEDPLAENATWKDQVKCAIREANEVRAAQETRLQTSRSSRRWLSPAI